MRKALSQVHELVKLAADRSPDSIALMEGSRSLNYVELQNACQQFANAAVATTLPAGGRIAVFLPKSLEAVIALMGTSAAGGCFVPINPVLKRAQVAHILADCDVELLVTSPRQWQEVKHIARECTTLKTVVLTGTQPSIADDNEQLANGYTVIPWTVFMKAPRRHGYPRIDADMAAILYTSGSTGKPKGVVLSHRNLLAGAESVCSYLNNSAQDRILALLPLSFHAGLSQLTTAFNAGACAVLFDYLLPRDTLRAIDQFEITGLGGVPSLWNQLAKLTWEPGCGRTLRYITNTGGALPVATTRTLRSLLPDTQIFLMYGLTEAFRSTCLPPDEVDRIPESIGKAIPNAQILVVNDQGRECAAGEPGELVHRGSLVSLGYWNDASSTAQRFRPAPGQDQGIPTPEIAVWSGDRMVRDKDGYLFFVGRDDEMIKTSGYRISPTEIEEIAYADESITTAAAIGVPHPLIGEAIILILVVAQDFPANTDNGTLPKTMAALYKRELPGFMQPQKILMQTSIPLNANGKVDRKALQRKHKSMFQEVD